jgi:hypothetical protein
MKKTLLSIVVGLTLGIQTSAERLDIKETLTTYSSDFDIPSVITTSAFKESTTKSFYKDAKSCEYTINAPVPFFAFARISLQPDVPDDLNRTHDKGCKCTIDQTRDPTIFSFTYKGDKTMIGNMLLAKTHMKLDGTAEENYFQQIYVMDTKEGKTKRLLVFDVYTTPTMLPIVQSQVYVYSESRWERFGMGIPKFGKEFLEKKVKILGEGTEKTSRWLQNGGAKEILSDPVLREQFKSIESSLTLIHNTNRVDPQVAQDQKRQ